MTTALAATISVLEVTPSPHAGDASRLQALVRHALTEEGQTGEWEISIALMSDDDVRRLHHDFLGLDTVTDIMTFPHGEGERGGDIAISVNRAAEHAPEFGLTVCEEIRFLVVHGVLHLCGWEDGDDDARRRMLARQTEIIETWEPA